MFLIFIDTISEENRLIFKINEMPYREENLMKVAAFAADAHAGQRRKYVNEPYIEHPVRVMYTCMSQNMTMPVLCAALLHDVLEDTKVSEDELMIFLRRLFNHGEAIEILSLVLQLTDIYTYKKYPYWNRRLRKAAELERLKTISSEAQSIKYADILDNISVIVHEDESFAKVLLKEYQELLKVLDKGNSVLRAQALLEVNENISKLDELQKKVK